MLAINNLQARFERHRAGIDVALHRVVDRGWVVLGPEVEAFEAEFAKYLGVGHCVGVANGTDAIELGLRAFGVSAGSQVATVANAGMYTSTAILAIGAKPWFMDVDPSTQNVTLKEVVRAADAGCRTVVITHLYGRAVREIVRIVEFCTSRGIDVLEDCAQAHGARIDGRRVGTFGGAAAFSFYPTKNLGALGDGGAVVTSDSDLANRLNMLRQYGWSSKYSVSLAGARNSRLDEIQAAVLREFLPHLDGSNSRRRDIARTYAMGVNHPHIRLPEVEGEDYVAHLFVIRTKERASLRQHLSAHAISSDVHYPVPDHRQPIFANRIDGTCLRETEVLADEVLTLPCFPEMTGEEIEHVIDAVNGWVP